MLPLLLLPPAALQGVVAHSNFEHRTSGPAAAQAVYDQALARDQQQQQAEGGKSSGSNGKSGSSNGSNGGSSAAGFLYVVYANFLRQVGRFGGTASCEADYVVWSCCCY
jgi:hypothetical protein